MRIYAWQSLLETEGPVNWLLSPFGFGDTNWLEGKPITVILGLVYGYIPFMILPLYAFLDRIEGSLLEAGRDLGASGRETFWRVTLPLSRPAILTGIVIVTLPMFGDYYTNDLLGHDEDVDVRQPDRPAEGGDTGGATRAASLVLMLSLIVFIPMLYYLRETRKQARAGMSAVAETPAAVIRRRHGVLLEPVAASPASCRRRRSSTCCGRCFRS